MNPPYLCDYCGEKYTTVYNVKKHMEKCPHKILENDPKKKMSRKEQHKREKRNDEARRKPQWQDSIVIMKRRCNVSPGDYREEPSDVVTTQDTVAEMNSVAPQAFRVGENRVIPHAHQDSPHYSNDAPIDSSLVESDQLKYPRIKVEQSGNAAEGNQGYIRNSIRSRQQIRDMDCDDGRRMQGTVSDMNSVAPQAFRVGENRVIPHAHQNSTSNAPYESILAETTMRSLMNSRIKVEPSGNAAEYQCQLCGNKYLSEANLEAHLRSCNTKKDDYKGMKETDIKANDGGIQTMTTGINTKRNNSREQHRWTIDDRKKHLELIMVCIKCKKGFKSYENLQSHDCLLLSDDTFTTEIVVPLPEEWEDLMKVYKRKMRNLMRYGVFKCEYCQKDFTRLDNLKVHIRIQHKKKMSENTSGVVCDVCKTAFRSMKSVQHHKRRMHGAKKYECPHCDKKFVYASDLKAHIKTCVNRSK
ncbi:hypothetical protein CRE_19879 [Caenorhabditis remanei]|uniref:C2H2-type domain-containing protein n=1 Tax=Caenorhabditis remanei TaxID=31234 RepID=E3N2W9_CAERE|nr:hypothetical protein CRE_19879 [Caenorhabditis remanei]